MSPTDPNVKDRPIMHRAIAVSSPAGDATFMPRCSAGDFMSDELFDTVEAATDAKSIREHVVLRKRRSTSDRPPLVWPAARDRLESGLRDLGFDVRRREGLAAFPAGADVNPPTGASGQGAPTGAREGGQ